MRLSLLAILPLMTGCTMTMHSVGDHTTNYHAGANVGWQASGRTGASPTAHHPASPSTGSHTAANPTANPGQPAATNPGVGRPAQGVRVTTTRPANATPPRTPHNPGSGTRTPSNPGGATSPRTPSNPGGATSPRRPSRPSGHVATTSPRTPRFPGGSAHRPRPGRPAAATPSRTNPIARPTSSRGSARPGRSALGTSPPSSSTRVGLNRPTSPKGAARPGKPSWPKASTTPRPGRPHAKPTNPGLKTPPGPGPCARKRCLPVKAQRRNSR